LITLKSTKLVNQKNNGCCYNGLGLPRDTFAVSSKVFWGGKKKCKWG
jgi:hypothetical protein